MLYSSFGHIDFISASALGLEYWEISIHWHAENTSSITKNINLRFLPGGNCSQAHKFKRMKIWALRMYFLPSSTPSRYPLPHHLPPKSTLPIILPWKSNSNTNSVCKWLFLISVCSCEDGVRSCVFVIVCACVCFMFVPYWLLLVRGEMRMDQCKEGRTEDNTQTTRLAKRMKETQNEPRINLRQEERFI